MIKKMAACDISHQNKAVYTCGNIIINKFKHCCKEVTVKLFMSYCNSFYCAHMWHHYRQESVRKLQTAYCFKVIWRKFIFSFRKRILESDNTIVFSIVNSLAFLDSSTTEVWLDS